MESQLEVMCCTTRSHLKLVERFGTVKQIGLSVIINFIANYCINRPPIPVRTIPVIPIHAIPL